MVTHFLPLATCLVLPSSSPAAWSAAVGEAARLLSPAWSGNKHEDAGLRTLALLLYARTHTGDRTPTEVPLDEVRDAVDAPDGTVPSREPAMADEIWQALRTAGHKPALSAPDHEVSPVWLSCREVSNQYKFPASLDDVEPEPPGASPMRESMPFLTASLAEMTEHERQLLEPVTVAPGTLEIETPGVMVTARYSRVRVMCWEQCPADAGTGRLTVDGPVAYWTCPAGHGAPRTRLSAPHVRNALRALGMDPITQGRLVLSEPFDVANADAPEDVDVPELFGAASLPLHLAGREDVFRELDRWAAEVAEQ